MNSTELNQFSRFKHSLRPVYSLYTQKYFFISLFVLIQHFSHIPEITSLPPSTQGSMHLTHSHAVGYIKVSHYYICSVNGSLLPMFTLSFHLLHQPKISSTTICISLSNSIHRLTTRGQFMPSWWLCECSPFHWEVCPYLSFIMYYINLLWAYST